MKTRLAPTPSGFLHLGNLLVFAASWRHCRQHGGQLLLRIDDLDAERKRPEYVADIFDSLQWLGIDWDEGPQSVAAFNEQWSQHLRLPLYAQLLEELVQQKLVYACGCSRTELLGTGINTRQHRCRTQNLPLNTAGCAWRLRLPEKAPVQFTDSRLGSLQLDAATLLPDPVVRRKEGLPAYQVASLADDLYFGIDTVWRGEDLLPSTVLQLWLAQVLEQPAFAKIQFTHLPLLHDANGQKLSKSKNARPVNAARLAGQKPDELWSEIDRLLKSPQ